jgi:hypothetical protein
MCILKLVRQLRKAGSPAENKKPQKWDSLIEKSFHCNSRLKEEKHG